MDLPQLNMLMMAIYFIYCLYYFIHIWYGYRQRWDKNIMVVSFILFTIAAFSLFKLSINHYDPSSYLSRRTDDGAPTPINLFIYGLALIHPIFFLYGLFKGSVKSK